MSNDQNQNKGQGHDIQIIVNGQEKTVEKGELTFEEVVSLAYDGNPPQGDQWVFSVSYRKGDDHHPAGELLPGKSVKVKKGMIFNVTATDKS